MNKKAFKIKPNDPHHSTVQPSRIAEPVNLKYNADCNPEYHVCITISKIFILTSLMKGTK